jgi:hypothetical protein
MVRRTTWVLLGGLAVVSLAYLASRQWEAGNAPSATPEAVPAWSLTTDQVQSVQILDVAQDRTVEVRRDPSLGWRIVTPPAGPPDVGAIEAGVTSIVRATVRQRLDSDAKASDYGLDPPAFKITVTRSDGTTVSAAVGNLDPTGTVYYVQIEGDPGIVMLRRYSLEESLAWPAQPPVAAATATPTAG